MKQPTKGNKSTTKKPAKKISKYGISQLERDFAKDYLDKLNLNYVYQYHAKDIGRYFDFAVKKPNNYKYEKIEKDGIMSVKNEESFIPDVLIEVDGGYYHGDPRFLKEGKLSPMQKRNQHIDKIKGEWSASKDIPLLRFWEHDIINDRPSVLSQLTIALKVKESWQKANKIFRKLTTPKKTVPSARQPHKKPH